MKIFGIIGWSGSGKTTLIKLLIPFLVKKGYSVSTMKHTHHDFDIDQPGKDSFEHRKAGAKQVLVTGAKRWALLAENFDCPEPSIDELLNKMEPVDLVLIEGFKTFPHPKMEIYRTALGKPLLAKNDRSVISVASDDTSLELRIPVINLNNLQTIAEFVIDYCDLNKREKNGPIKG